MRGQFTLPEGRIWAQHPTPFAIQLNNVFSQSPTTRPRLSEPPQAPTPPPPFTHHRGLKVTLGPVPRCSRYRFSGDYCVQSADNCSTSLNWTLLHAERSQLITGAESPAFNLKKTMLLRQTVEASLSTVSVVPQIFKIFISHTVTVTPRDSTLISAPGNVPKVGKGKGQSASLLYHIRKLQP